MCNDIVSRGCQIDSKETKTDKYPSNHCADDLDYCPRKSYASGAKIFMETHEIIISTGKYLSARFKTCMFAHYIRLIAGIVILCFFAAMYTFSHMFNSFLMLLIFGSSWIIVGLRGEKLLGDMKVHSDNVTVKNSS